MVFSVSDAKEGETLALLGIFEGRVVVHIQDVCKDYASLQAFCDLLNRLDPSPLHIQDMVEDFCANDYQIAQARMQDREV